LNRGQHAPDSENWRPAFFFKKGVNMLRIFEAAAALFPNSCWKILLFEIHEIKKGVNICRIGRKI